MSATPYRGFRFTFLYHPPTIWRHPVKKSEVFYAASKEDATKDFEATWYRNVSDVRCEELTSNPSSSFEDVYRTQTARIAQLESDNAALRAEVERLREENKIARTEGATVALKAYTDDLAVLRARAEQAEACTADMQRSLEAEQQLRLQAEAALEEARRDSERLVALKENGWSLKCFSLPTGGDDFATGWQITQQHMGEDEERIIAEVHDDDPRKTIDSAIDAARAEKDWP